MLNIWFGLVYLVMGTYIRVYFYTYVSADDFTISYMAVCMNENTLQLWSCNTH